MPDLEAGPGADLRLPALAALAWAAALVALRAPAAIAGLGLVGLAAAGAVVGVRRRELIATLLAGLVVVVAVGGGAVVRRDVTAGGPVAALAGARAAVRVDLTVVGDPVVKAGRFAPYVVVRTRVDVVTGRGHRWQTRAPVLVIGSPAWSRVALGNRVAALGRLAPARDDDELAGVLTTSVTPTRLTGPDPWWRASAVVRRDIRSVAHGPPLGAALVPALVDGDQGRLPDDVVADFRTTGLTHLLAVSGTNLTIVVGFLVAVARWAGLRGRGLLVVAAVGIAAFVVLARTEPSVLRAAVMGSVALVGLRSNGRGRGVRALSAAVVVLLLVDPTLAVTPGFVLSALATAGILFLAPGWREALGRWLPRWLAEAVAVPTAAQLACTPVVAGLSGQVSLVAVAANLAAAPAVGPATLLGVAGGLVRLLPGVGGLGDVAGWTAGWCAAWIVVVARHAAALPLPAVGWGSGPLALAALTLLCLVVVVVLPALLRRPVAGLSTGALLLGVVVVPLPSPGWPPSGWVMVACDVGQGDGLVLRAGPGTGVVVDTGPDPRLMDHCLGRLGIDRVPLVVLTHFHADHVDGLPGVYDGRRVAEVDVTADDDPAANVAAVRREVVGRSRLVVPAYGETRRVGDLTVEVLGPVPGEVARAATEDEGSGPNDASIVLLVVVRGLRLLLSGDVEPSAQEALARAWPGLAVDVLKVPHHGSRYQDLPWLLSLRARAAVVSVGADNDYGQPSADILGALTRAGLAVRRTDRDGDVAVVVDPAGHLRLATRG